MGIHLPDIQTYINIAEKTSGRLNTLVLTIAVVSLLLLFLAGLIVLSVLEKWYMQRAGRSMREESNKDPLTGTFNRRISEVYLNEAFKRFQLSLSNPALVFFDIDNFKKVNDTWGHETGDIVLKAVTDQIAQTLRSTDHLFRWGGEEFLLIADGINPENALNFAAKLNQVIAQHLFPVNADSHENPINVTISIGISWFDVSDQRVETALNRADQALYRAKS
ncbi:MAG: GGDEF domain-containing protein, partial [Treponemataceae bacterium]